MSILPSLTYILHLNGLPQPSSLYNLPPELEMALLKHIHLFVAKALRVVAYRDTAESIVQGTPAYCILLTSCWLVSDFHLIVFLFKMSAAPAVNLISISYCTLMNNATLEKNVSRDA